MCKIQKVNEEGGAAMVVLGTRGFSRNPFRDHFKPRIPQERVGGRKISGIIEDRPVFCATSKMSFCLLPPPSKNKTLN